MNKTKLIMPLNKFSSRFSLSFLIFLLVCFLSTSTFAQTPPAAPDPLVAQGEAIFKANCSSCHKLGSVKVGPALSGAVGRWGSEAKMIDFIKHPAVTATKDPYAKTLLAKFAPTVMPNQDFLKDDELKAIAAYIKGGKDEEIKGTSPVPTPGTEQKAETPYMLYTLIVIVLILLVIVLCLILVVVKKYLKDEEASLATEDKELVNQKFSIKAVVKSNIFITIISLLFIGVAAKSCWVGLMALVSTRRMLLNSRSHSHTNYTPANTRSTVTTATPELPKANKPIFHHSTSV